MTPGSRVGSYEIVAAIGAGGMGEVFRARDTKLNRDVAIKVLPTAFADDHERLARFTREAQTLASVNHPNIAAIYGVEDIPASDGAGSGSRALVMELVVGEDLSVHIGKGPIPLPEALPLARQIVDAIEAAHEQGIIHRDLKPANIKVRVDGTIKILDFGLAKAVDPSGTASSNPNLSHSPTLTHQGTSAGMIIGTAAYMSPEQAKGKIVDRRTDIWAFGVVLFEMLTGKRLFAAEDLSDTLAAVLRADIDLSLLPLDTPAAVRQLLRRCLERDSRKRLRDIGDARLVLDELVSGEPASAPSPETRRSPAGRWFAAAGAAVGLVLAFTWGKQVGAPVEEPPVHLNVDFGADGLRVDGEVMVSPDGRRVAFVGVDGEGKAYLATRRLDEARLTRLTPVDSVRRVFFSPDSEWIGYITSDRQVMKVAVAGGPSTRIASTANVVAAPVTWDVDREIVIPSFTGLTKLSLADGSVTFLGRAGSGQFLPDGQTLLVSGWGTSLGPIEVVSPGTTSPRRVTKFAGRNARYLESGYLVYIGERNVLQALAFDIDRMEGKGAPLALVENVQRFSLSETGTLIFTQSDAADPERMLAWVDASGVTEDLLGESGHYHRPQLSPNGRSLAFGSRDGNDTFIAVRDLAHGVTRRLVQSAFSGDTLKIPSVPPKAGRPVSPALWLPDGSHILHTYQTGGLGMIRADGSGSSRQLLETNAVPESISADGKYIAFVQRQGRAVLRGADTQRDILLGRLEGQGDALKVSSLTPLVGGASDDLNPAFSPDGRWLAYSSDVSGEFMIYVLDIEHPESRWLVSSTAGFQPQWSPNGRDLFFKEISPGGERAGLLVASYSVSGGVFVPGTVRTFGGKVSMPAQGGEPVYNVGPAGRRVLAVIDPRPADATPSRPIFGMVLNLTREIRRREGSDSVY